MGTDTFTVKVLLCDTADEVTRLQHALRMLDAAMEIQVTTESDRVIEMAAGMQPDVVATEPAAWRWCSPAAPPATC